MDTPAPWSLTGRGFILIYRFPEDFIRESCFIPEEWKILKWSGLGYMILMDYKESPVGPFSELLVIPGKASLDGKRLRTISKIYVDSVDSMYDGKNNWGLPRELTDFKWTNKDRRYLIQIGSYAPWFEMRLEAGGISFPVNTSVLPIHLYQEYNGQKFSFSPTGKGTGRFALVKDVKVDPFYFPELNLLEPLVAIYVDPFRLKFPVANVEQIDGYSSY